MTRCYAMLKLLEHGPLNRRELADITGWTERQLHGTLAYLASTEKIVRREKKWTLPSDTGVQQQAYA